MARVRIRFSVSSICTCSTVLSHCVLHESYNTDTQTAMGIHHSPHTHSRTRLHGNFHGNFHTRGTSNSRTHSLRPLARAVKYSPSHLAHRATPTSDSLAVGHCRHLAPAEAARPWTRGQCVARCACLPPSLRWYQIMFDDRASHLLQRKWKL